MSRLRCTLAFALASAPAGALAQGLEEPPPPPASASPAAPQVEAHEAPEPAIELSGYGELLFRYHDHGPDQTRPGGAPADDRLVFDTTRFVLELEGELPGEVELEAEIEFEHGGTGSALELEFEEFGEYEQEVEKGGEVLVEELYLEREFTDWLEVKAGRFYVAVGLLSELYEPTRYLGASRPESETTVLPAVWDEMGVSATIHLEPVEITAQVVSGLDSTGFSSQFWIASGHQRRFELVRASSLAGVLRVDATPLPGLVVGASGYAGNTTGGRPSPDMEGRFAPVVITDAHATVDIAPFRARAVALWGYLNDAALISEKNRRLSNNLDVLRSPVAEQALAAWGELGVDVAPSLGLAPAHRLEPFVRLERYDTMLEAGEHTFDNPRFSRTVYAGGVAYTLADATVTTLSVTHRRFGSGDLRAETSAELGLGFVY